MRTYNRETPICSSRVLKRTAALAAFLCAISLPLSAFALDIFLGTGESGTFSHFSGRTICRMINRQAADMTCRTVPAADDVHNLTNLKNGSLDIALIDSRMLTDAVTKAGYFEFLDIGYESLRVLIPLYDVPVTLVVRKDANIRTLSELKGKRINAGAPRSPEQLAVDTILKAKHWSKRDFRLVAELPASQSQDTMAFCHGTVQAMVHIGVHPNPSLSQLVKLCQAGLVDMDDGDIVKLIADHPAYLKLSIAADAYPSQTRDVSTFGTTMVLAAAADLDDQTVYSVIAAIDGNRARMKSAHPALLSSAAQTVSDEIAGVRLHAGAVKYFSERKK